MTGRLMCLSAPRELCGRREIVSSVAAQAVAVASVAAGFALPFLFLIALPARFAAALFFTRFLIALARHFDQTRLMAMGQTLENALWIPMKVISIGLPVVCVLCVLGFLLIAISIFVPWLAAAGSAIRSAAATGGYLVGLAVLSFLGIIEVYYAILVVRLAMRTAQAVKESNGSGAAPKPDKEGLDPFAQY